MTFDNIKSHKKSGLQPLSRRFLEKLQGGAKLIPPPGFLGLKMKYQHVQQFLQQDV